MKVRCWKCGGKGWLFDHEEGVLTFGISYLIQAVAGKHARNIYGEYINERCPVCKGKGYQEDASDEAVRN